MKGILDNQTFPKGSHRKFFVIERPGRGFNLREKVSGFVRRSIETHAMSSGWPCLIKSRARYEGDSTPAAIDPTSTVVPDTLGSSAARATRCRESARRHLESIKRILNKHDPDYSL